VVKFTVTNGDGSVVVGLGLDERFPAGDKPVFYLNLHELALPHCNAEVVIFWGRTEEEIAEMLRGFIGPGVEIVREEVKASA
jgi:hypothetical protein